MPAPKKSREEVIELIADAFRCHGYDGTSLRLISEATGLGRASLYHYFPDGKEQMGREVFEHIGAHVQRALLDPLSDAGSPEERLAAWIRGVNRFYDGGKKNCLLGSMVLGGGNDRYTAEIAATFRALIDALSGVLRQAGLSRATAEGRAIGAVATIQGALVTARGLGDNKLFRRSMKDLPSQLLRPVDDGGAGR